MNKPEIEASKTVILKDMLSFLHYTRNRESDLLAFMEQYQKADTERRPVILTNLRACMDGEVYPNPYEGTYGYTHKDVAQCEKILNAFLSDLSATENDASKTAACEEKAVAALNALDDACNGTLLDTWRREHLRAFLDVAAAQAQQDAQVLSPSLGMA